MNDLMIPSKAEVPAYLLNPELARQANNDALQGISTGAPPRIKLAGKQFALVDGNGQETPFLPAKLTAGPDGNLYLPVIILRAKTAIQKSWYAHAFNPNAEASAPDCFSNDGIAPDVLDGATPPVCSVTGCPARTCSECDMNAYGSGKDQSGNPTNGKACADNKILAVFVPNHGVHQFKIPPASLKNFGIYVKQLSAAGLALGTVKTFVGFDMAATFPVLVFKFGGYVPEDAVGKLAELAQSLEAEEIVGGRIQVAPKRIAAPVQTMTAAPAPAVQTVTPAPVVDDLGLEATPAPAAAPKRGRPAKVQEIHPAPAAQAAPAAPAAAPSDDALRAELGL